MLPNKVLSTTPVPATFLAPRGIQRCVASSYFDFTPSEGSAAVGALTPQTLGPNGYRDTTLGLASQVWTGSVDYYGNITLAGANGATIAPFQVPNIIWFDFCFDQSANPVIVYSDSTKASYFYWYDTVNSRYATTAIAAGSDPWPFCQIDDFRPVEVSASDVIITYTRGGHLYFLAQRDRYGTEYDLGAIPNSPPMMLVAFGMSHGLRLQFQFAQVLPDLSNAYGKFVGSPVFKAVEISRVGDVIPRIWPAKKNNTVQA
jgi:hypothetical protein